MPLNGNQIGPESLMKSHAHHVYGFYRRVLASVIILWSFHGFGDGWNEKHMFPFGEAAPAAFVRGDANADGIVSLADVIFLQLYLFTEDSDLPPCLKAADANDDGSVNIVDSIYLLNYIGRSAPPPSSAWPERGADPTPEDGLDCRNYLPVSPVTDEQTGLRMKNTVIDETGRARRGVKKPSVCEWL